MSEEETEGAPELPSSSDPTNILEFGSGGAAVWEFRGLGEEEQDGEAARAKPKNARARPVPNAKTPLSRCRAGLCRVKG